MDLRRVCKLLLTSVSPCQQAPRNKMAVLAELSQFTWSGVRPDDAWERPRIQVENNARGRRSSASASLAACAQPPLPSKKSSFPILLRGGAAIHRLVVRDFRSNRQNNTSSRPSRFFVHFFAVTARL